MKIKRLLTAGVTAALALSFAVLNVSAAPSFPDVENHWAKSYIVEMTEAGLFTGYEDGTFRPDRTLSAAEALSLCARTAIQTYGLDNAAVAKMQAVWQEDLEDLLGKSYSWFYDEAAVALETGILSWTDLSQRVQAGALSAPLQKELFSVYMVRAMGLDNLARSLSAYTLDFADASSITRNYQPYVYLLSSYGVLTGDQNQRFNPASAVDRAVSATMLARVLSYMEVSGLSPELAEYTDYSWVAGSITAVTPGERSTINLVLSNPVTGESRLNIPASVKIYRSDRLTTTSDLKAGYYARVCYDKRGTAYAVRLYETARMTTVSGSLVSVDEDSITILANGTQSTYPIDRFTEVYMGGQTGDRTLIDANGGYSDATVRSYESGTAAAVQLYGGSRLEEGFLSEVTARTGGGYTIQITGFDGASRRLTVELESPVLINGISGALRNSYVGSYIAARVSNDDPSVCSQVEVNTVALYTQGSIKSLINTAPYSITVTELDSNKSTKYAVPEDAEIYLEGRRATINDLSVGFFVTAEYNIGSEAVRISAWPGTVETAGELTEITYGSTTILTVTREDGVSVQFALDMTDLPTIVRDGKTSTVTKLTTGDQVEITVRYQEITHIEATSQSANAEGVIETVTHAADSSVLTIRLSDGTVETYTLSQSAALTQNDNLISRITLQPGYRLSMLVSGQVILAAEVESSVASTNRITGRVLFVDVSAQEVLFQLDTGAAITVNVTSSTRYTNAADGASFSLRSLAVGDSLTVYGGYRGGEYDATLIVRE